MQPDTTTLAAKQTPQPARLVDHPLFRRARACWRLWQILQHPWRPSRRRPFPLPVDKNSSVCLTVLNTPDSQGSLRADAYLTTHARTQPAPIWSRWQPAGGEIELRQGLLAIDHHPTGKAAFLLTLAFPRLRFGIGEHTLAALAQGTLHPRLETATFSVDADAEALLQCPSLQGPLPQTLHTGQTLLTAFQRDGLKTFLLTSVPDLQLDLWLRRVSYTGPASFLNMSLHFIASRVRHAHLVARTDGGTVFLRATAEVDLPVSAWVLKQALRLSRYFQAVAWLPLVEVQATPPGTLQITLPETAVPISSLMAGDKEPPAPYA